VKTKPFKVIAFCVLLLVFGALIWAATAGSATWHVRRIFPGARVYHDPVNSPDITLGTFARLLFPSYVGIAEDSVGFELSDVPEPIDFSRLRGRRFLLHSVRLNRCKVSDLLPLESAGTPFVVFTDCDFSALPAEQRPLLSTYDPAAAEPNRKLTYS
jgi:hypothetical protein